VAGQPRSFMAHASALTDDSNRHMGVVCVFDDLTELEKAQRMAAWREVARRIAHEVKNPLTPITLSAQRLKRKYAARLNEPVFEECVRMIIDHVELIRNMVNEFSAFARFPAAVREPCELAPIVEETIALYREGYEQVRFGIHIRNPIPTLHLDRQQIKQALINLVDNAVTAVRRSGTVTVTLSHDPENALVLIEVADDGMGIPLKNRSRLFEPNFSTKKSGMGLGLTIVNTILSEHGGTIRAESNLPRGAKFVIELPA
jgi:two-component system nitrogen regulation sensor histidine kinase NtrY